MHQIGKTVSQSKDISKFEIVSFLKIAYNKRKNKNIKYRRIKKVERTEILNQAECGYNYFVTMRKAIIAVGLKGGVQKLDIIRVIVVADNSAKPVSFLSKLGITKSDINYDVDVDIFVANGAKIEVHSSEPKFLKKLLPYIWELKRNNPRIEFYGDVSMDSTEVEQQETYYSEEQVKILTEQLLVERKIYQSLNNQLDDLLLKYTEDDMKVLSMQKRILASRKRILRMSKQISTITNNLLQEV